MTTDLIYVETGEVNKAISIIHGIGVDIDAVQANLSHLLMLYRNAKLSAEDLAEAIKGTAKKAGVSAWALKRYVVSRASEKYEEKRAESAQLQLMFEEIA